MKNRVLEMDIPETGKCNLGPVASIVRAKHTVSVAWYTLLKLRGIAYAMVSQHDVVSNIVSYVST
jgi:hypothetical protein